MAENQFTPSEEPTAPLPTIPESTPAAPVAPVYAEYAAPSSAPTTAGAPAPAHPGMSTPAILAVIAAGALALLFAFVAGWASHGIASRVAVRGFGPGGAMAYSQQRGGQGGFGQGIAQGGAVGCPAFGQGGQGGTAGGQGGFGRGRMMNRGWQQSSPGGSGGLNAPGQSQQSVPSAPGGNQPY